MQITISGDDKKLLKHIEALAKHLGLNVEKAFDKKTVKQKEKKSKRNNQELLKLLKEAGSNSDLFQSIEDPVAWQIDQRKDKILKGREE